MPLQQNTKNQAGFGCWHWTQHVRYGHCGYGYKRKVLPNTNEET